MVSIGSFLFSLFLSFTSFPFQAHEHGNLDATNRLSALSAPSGQTLFRQEQDTITEIKLVRTRTLAAQRSETQPQSPPGHGTAFPTPSETSAAPVRDGSMVLEGIRKNALPPTGYDPPQSNTQSPLPSDGWKHTP